MICSPNSLKLLVTMATNGVNPGVTPICNSPPPPPPPHTHTYIKTQHDVIGQNLTDITDDDDAAIINENLQPKTTPLPTHLNGRTEMQRRQFYVRIKSTVTPGRMQLSRFKSQIVSLFLKH